MCPCVTVYACPVYVVSDLQIPVGTLGGRLRINGDGCIPIALLLCALSAPAY